ncbi:MAG: hypothetical protein R8L07_13740 [Alphaproteobacteria bacterium]|nr:hypothetical protein [Alphaproteobacteria bacterium]
MKAFVLPFAALLLVAPVVSASAQTVTDKKTCLQAVADARASNEESAVSAKVKEEVASMVQIADHLCTQANFVFAEKLLGIARGMTAQE